MAAENTSRRGFLKLANRLAILAGLGAVLTPIIAYFYPKELQETPSEPVSVGPPDELPVGASRTVQFGRYPALIVNTPGGLRAYSAVCTHFACIVKWDAAEGWIECPCHEGYFDAEDGSVIAGPPPRALDPLPVFVAEDGLIYVGGESGSAALTGSARRELHGEPT